MNCVKTKKRTFVQLCNPWYNRVSRKGKINHNAHSVYMIYYHRKSGKSFGKKPFGVRVSALLTVGGDLVEVIHQDIETQGGKKY